MNKIEAAQFKLSTLFAFFASKSARIFPRILNGKYKAAAPSDKARKMHRDVVLKELPQYRMGHENDL